MAIGALHMCFDDAASGYGEVIQNKLARLCPFVLNTGFNDYTNCHCFACFEFLAMDWQSTVQLSSKT